MPKNPMPKNHLFAISVKSAQLGAPTGSDESVIFERRGCRPATFRLTPARYTRIIAACVNTPGAPSLIEWYTLRHHHTQEIKRT